ncbi:hypothetical protein J6U78_04430 [bacterium]|jgi:hypothetical protein|nr:hypothetical protein [bacterium]
MRDALLILLVLFLQISSAKLFGGIFFDFLTPLLLLWSITKPFREVILWTIVTTLLVSAIYPQPFLVILTGLILAQWIFRASFFENWRRKPGLVFAAGVSFSFMWQFCGLVFASVTTELITMPLSFPPLLSSFVSAGLFTVIVFRVAMFKAELEGDAW